MKEYVPDGVALTEAQQLLIGGCFTQEYSVEAAALFNPSMVPHPDQKGVPEGSVRFVMSLRATGEGHISSIVFRTGIVDKEGNVTFDKTEKHLEAASISATTTYDKALFGLKLKQVNVSEGAASTVLHGLGSRFSYNEFTRKVTALETQGYFTSRPEDLERIKHLGLSDYIQPDYDIAFPRELALSGRVIFPRAEFERRGMEDARFVRFTEGDGRNVYHATYTACGGSSIAPQVISTEDFTSFQVHSLAGAAAKGKGMALFPRKINGKYVMLGREDGESISIMFSDDLHTWEKSSPLHAPVQPWEIIQTGNCGSPIETEAGWLVITHGVDVMRQYTLGAVLLDLNDPSKVIGRIKHPILSPVESERDGYVPNVVYSCGAMKHGDHLILPYAASDQTYNVATLSIKELLSQMEDPKSLPAAGAAGRVQESRSSRASMVNR